MKHVALEVVCTEAEISSFWRNGGTQEANPRGLFHLQTYQQALAVPYAVTGWLASLVPSSHIWLSAVHLARDSFM